MSAPIIAFFSPRGGQGRTTLVYHLAWIFSDLGVRVLAADLDHQISLTQRFLGPDRAAALAASETGLGALRSFVEGNRDLEGAPLVLPGGEVALLAGDIDLLEMEPTLDHGWQCSMTGDARAVSEITALRRLLLALADRHSARVVLVDLAPSGGIINRAAFAASDHFVFPLVPDVLSVRSLRWVGQQMERWRGEWRPRRMALTDTTSTPEDGPRALGYVVRASHVLAGRPIAAQQRLLGQIPAEFERWIARSNRTGQGSIADDERCLGVLSSYSSLFQIAEDAGKPVFHLTPADGAIGSVMTGAQRAGAELQSLARVIADRLQIALD